MPPLPGVPQVPLAESFARAERVSGRHVPRAARGGGRVRRRVTTGADRGRRGRGRPDPALRADVPRPGPARGDRRRRRTSLYRIATELDGAEADRRAGRRRPDLALQPEQSDAGSRRRRPISSRSRARARTPSSSSTRRTSSTAANRRAVSSQRRPNLIVLRTLSKAFGFAALRVGYARRGAGDRGAARRAAGAGAGLRPRPRGSRPPRCATRASTSSRRSPSASGCARRSSRPASTLPPSAANFVCAADGGDGSPSGSRRRGSSSGASRRASGSRCAGRPRTTCSCARSAPSRGRPPGRSAIVIRTTTETALRISLDLDGAGASRVATGIGFLDHLLTLLAFHAGFDLELLAGGDLDVDEHHTVEDVLAALGIRCRAGARDARGRRPLRLGRRADGRGARDRRGRPRAAPARRDRARLRRRPRRRARADAAAARARALRDGGRLHGARRGVGRGRPPRRRGGVQGARAGAPRRVAIVADGVRSTKGERVRRRARRAASCSPTTVPATCAASRRRSCAPGASPSCRSTPQRSARRRSP